MKKMGNSWVVLIFCLIIVFGIGSFGSLFTKNEINSEWYQSVRPNITPPSWIFPVVWNVLFLLISISLWLVWTKSKKKNKIVIWYGINLISNGLWSLFYFGMHRPGVAFVDLIIIWISIIGMIFTSFKIDRKASYLLIPYLLWISLAGILNYLSI